MHLYINMKQLGKRKNMVDKVAFSYEKAPESLRELIGETVKLCVANYIDRMDKGEAVLSKEQILEKLWDCEGNFIDGSALTVYIRRLRIKVEDNPSQPQMLLTVRGMGYKWNVIC